MLTIQSFLLKIRKGCISKDMRKNVKYACLIFAYTFIAVLLVVKFNIFHWNIDCNELEAFAAQNIMNSKEETPVLNQMNYLDLSLNASSVLEQNLTTAQWQELINQIMNSDWEEWGAAFGQAPLVTADIYAGDLVSMKLPHKKAVAAKLEEKQSAKVVQAKDKKKTKSASKDEAANEAKEAMNTGVAVISLSSKEVDILQRIVEAEATGEDIKGKILVANVIMNRVNDSAFPDSVEEVVFQRTGGTYQFSPISDKRYYSVKVTGETKEAVKRVLQGEDYSQGALYFSARKRASASNMRWFDSKLKWLFQYGGHEFFTHK